MTRATCPRCGARHCPAARGGGYFCPECGARFREVALEAAVRATDFWFQEVLARILAAP